MTKIPSYLIGLLAVAIGGCAGKVDYILPAVTATQGGNTKIIEKPRDVVWATSVPNLGKQFFVINTIDKSSGLINLSYTGDPESYVDCGRISSYVKNAQGERTYNFAGAKSQQSYEIMDPNRGLFLIDRRMNLEGRINLIFEEVTPASTRVTANTRYIITRSQAIRNVGEPYTQNISHSISFNSGGRAPFPPNNRGEFAECAANGVLEQEVLRAIQ